MSAVPLQVPVPDPRVQPGQLQPKLLHDAQLRLLGVPVQPGTWNTCGGGGSRLVVPQQMRSWPDVQSLSELHFLGQLIEQTPPQQMAPAVDDAQSESVAQDFGQSVVCRQSDFAPGARLGSSLPALAQQDSPPAVSHCELSVHAVGQSLDAVQIGVA